MQNKLRQLVISALKRNERTTRLPLNVMVNGYEVVVSGQVDSEHLVEETVRTIQGVSPHLRVHPRLTIRRERASVK